MTKPATIYTVTLGELAEVPGTPFAYWAPRSLRALFQKYPPLDRDVAGRPDQPKIADVKQGLATADDLRFTRYWWEVPVEQIATCREETLSGKKWVPFAKGGKAFFHDIAAVVNWGNNGEEIKAYIIERYPYLQGKWEWVVKNESFYFRPGLTFPNIVSSVRINARVVPIGSIITVKHQGVYASRDDRDWGLCAFLNSLLAAFIHYCMNPLRHGRDTGELSRLPTNELVLQSPALDRFAHEAWNLLQEWDAGDEASTQFILPWLLQVWDVVQGKWSEGMKRPVTGHPLAEDFVWSDWDSARRIRAFVPPGMAGGTVNLRALAEACVERERLLRGRIAEIQRQIDDEVYRLYDISAEDRALIESELGAAPEATGEEGAEPGEGEEEETAPEGLMPAEEHIRRLVHYLAHEAIRADENGIVPLQDLYTVDGRLEHGLPHRVREKLGEIFGEAALGSIEQDLRWALGMPLDDWLGSEFFSYHLGLYRLRPIIWQITSRPRGQPAFSCFLYWHKLDSDTLRKVQAVYLQPALDGARREVERLAAQLGAQQVTGAARHAWRDLQRACRQAEARLDELRSLNERLQRLGQPQHLKVTSRSTWVVEKVNEIVAHGYRPERDYGVRVNIEPLKQAGVLPASAERVKG
ncbi:MAG: hypothetical protein H5T68_12315 [Chloroflexi bacterium]|nr:hypothetical protein [Chloroflexota bacterium]